MKYQSFQIVSKRLALAQRFPLLLSYPFKMAELGGFAASLESEKGIRNRVRQNGLITRWISEEAIGVKSCKAMALNPLPLELLASWWCPAYPAGVVAMTISAMREEVGTLEQGSSLSTPKLVISFPGRCKQKFSFG